MRKIRGIFVVLSLALLCGCKKGEAKPVVEEEKPKTFVYQLEESYTVDVDDTGSTCHFYEDKVYCLEFEGTEEDSIYYLKSFDKNKETKEYRSDAFAHLQWKSWCINKTGDRDMLSILSKDDSGYIIVSVDLESLEAKTISVQDDNFKNKIISSIEITEDKKYILEGYENLYIINEKGGFDSYTYKVEGYSLFASDDKPGLQKSQTLYSVDLKTSEVLPKCCLSDSKIRNTDVIDIRLSQDKYYVLTREADVITVNVLAENRDAVKEEKVTLVLYQPLFRTIKQEDLDEFNFQNDKYEVVFDKHTADINFRFMMEDPVDIVYLTCYEALSLPDYAASGYILDLYPFIDKSEKVRRDDLIDAVKRGFETDGKLYGITEKVGFQTPFIYAEVDTAGYNAETAVDLFAKTAKERNLENLWAPNSMMDLVFTGITNEMLSDEEGNPGLNSGLNSGLVRDTLERIKQAAGGIEARDVLNINIPTRDYYFGVRDSIKNVADLCLYTDGYNLNPIGYPSVNGEPVYLQTYSDIMAISATSDYPEGAFEFIEFMMTKSELFGNNEGNLYCLKSLNKKGRFPGTLKNHTELTPITVVIEGEPFEVEFSDEKFDKLLDMSEHVVYDSMNYWNVMEIIVQETEPYFAGQKSLDEVMNIIESRVNLMLAEDK